MMKRLGIVLLMLCLLVLPAAAMALEVKIGDVVLPDGKYMASGGNTVVDTQPSGGYAHLKDGVLTLKDYSISGIFEQAIRVDDGNLEIRLVGENSLTNTRDDRDGIAAHKNTEIKVSGSGSLTIKADFGIYGYNGEGKIRIADGKMMIKSSFMAIRAKDFIISGGVLEIEAGGSGINTGEYVHISGGVVEVDAESQGIYSYKDIKISGGTTKITAFDDAVFGGGRITISGTDTIVDAKANDTYSDGVLISDEGISVESPLQILTPEGGAIDSGKYYYTVMDAEGNPAAKVYIAAGSSGAALLPQTGDSSMLMLWAMLACLAGAGALLLRRREAN